MIFRQFNKCLKGFIEFKGYRITGDFFSSDIRDRVYLRGENMVFEGNTQNLNYYNNSSVAIFKGSEFATLHGDGYTKLEQIKGNEGSWSRSGYDGVFDLSDVSEYQIVNVLRGDFGCTITKVDVLINWQTIAALYSSLVKLFQMSDGKFYMTAGDGSWHGAGSDIVRDSLTAPKKLLEIDNVTKTLKDFIDDVARDGADGIGVRLSGRGINLNEYTSIGLDLTGRVLPSHKQKHFLKVERG